MNKTYYFSNPQLPTPFNLIKHLLARGYHQGQPGDINDSHFNLEQSQTQLLEYKHLLAALSRQSCPEHMPLTLSIDDDNYLEVINQAREIMQQHHEPIVWILKPSMLNNGEGIKLFDSLEKLEQHYASSNRLGGMHVLQQYIVNPHLLRGHKYTLRMFVVLSNVAGAFIYPHGYFNIARKKYTSHDFNNTACHLTNEHLTTTSGPNNWQVPTARTENFNNIYLPIVQITTDILKALRNVAPNLFKTQDKTPAFGIFGFDYLLDTSLKPWLLEVNHGPCFPNDSDHPLQTHLYNQFWQDLITDVIEPTLALQVPDVCRENSGSESAPLFEKIILK